MFTECYNRSCSIRREVRYIRDDRKRIMVVEIYLPQRKPTPEQDTEGTEVRVPFSLECQNRSVQ